MSRLANDETIKKFCDFFGQHLGLISPSTAGRPFKYFSEEDKLLLSPLVFGLIPLSAIQRTHYDLRVRPLIEAHLIAIGVKTPPPSLVDILKRVADQYFMSRHDNSPRPKKLGIGDIRAGRKSLYDQIHEHQKGRCPVCGHLLNKVGESLDHIIPWRLVGDVPTGDNWQFLCKPCNEGKSDLISSFMNPEAYNWIYGDMGKLNGGIQLRNRYIALASRAKCEFSGCDANSASHALKAVRKSGDGIGVLDHLWVCCDQHG